MELNPFPDLNSFDVPTQRAGSTMEMVRHSEETYMALTTLLIIVLILVLLGGGWFGRGRWY